MPPNSPLIDAFGGRLERGDRTLPAGIEHELGARRQCRAGRPA